MFLLGSLILHLVFIVSSPHNCHHFIRCLLFNAPAWCAHGKVSYPGPFAPHTTVFRKRKPRREEHPARRARSGKAQCNLWIYWVTGITLQPWLLTSRKMMPELEKIYCEKWQNLCFCSLTFRTMVWYPNYIDCVFTEHCNSLRTVNSWTMGKTKIWSKHFKNAAYLLSSQTWVQKKTISYLCVKRGSVPISHIKAQGRASAYVKICCINPFMAPQGAALKIW